MLYILIDKTPVHEPDILKWARWFETANRIVAKSLYRRYEISTVFLAIDSALFGGPPLFFETMVFKLPRPTIADRWAGKKQNNRFENIQERYSTWEQAEAGHQRIVNRVVGLKGRGKR